MWKVLVFLMQKMLVFLICIWLLLAVIGCFAALSFLFFPGKRYLALQGGEKGRLVARTRVRGGHHRVQTLTEHKVQGFRIGVLTDWFAIEVKLALEQQNTRKGVNALFREGEVGYKPSANIVRLLLKLEGELFWVLHLLKGNEVKSFAAR